jgi:hypothetical protein
MPVRELEQANGAVGYENGWRLASGCKDHATPALSKTGRSHRKVEVILGDACTNA